jgi:hypothetical protein
VYILSSIFIVDSVHIFPFDHPMVKGRLYGARESFPRITPFLWFDNQAEDAVNFYLSVFKNSRRLETVSNTERYAGYVENEEVGYCRIGTGRRKLKK